MSRIKKKFIRLGTGTDDLNSRDVPANYTPVAYTPAAVGSEATTQVSAHLKGINNALSGLGSVSTDIGLTSWTSLVNNTANQTVTGFLLNSTVRSFRAEVNVYVDDGGTGSFTHYSLVGVRKGASAWSIYELTSDATGDNVDKIDWNILNSSGNGQVRITLGNISGFVSGLVQFRATTLNL